MVLAARKARPREAQKRPGKAGGWLLGALRDGSGGDEQRQGYPQFAGKNLHVKMPHFQRRTGELEDAPCREKPVPGSV